MKIIKLVPLLGLTAILVGCGGQYTDAEEKVKEEMKLLNTYVEDKENPDFDKDLEEKIRETMSEEEVAEREVEVELGLRDNVEGTYETYGVHEETESYVVSSIEKGLAIPKDGKVVEVVNGEDEEIENDKRDDLTVLMDNQRERLSSLEVRQETQDNINETDVNLKIIGALRERKSEIEQEIEDKKNQSEGLNEDLGLDKQISELEKELEDLEKNDRIGEGKSKESDESKTKDTDKE